MMTSRPESPISVDDDIVIVRQQAKRVAAAAKLLPQEQTRLATAVSEVAREILSRGCQGRAVFELDERRSPPLLLARMHVVAASGTSGDAPETTHLPVLDGEALIAARRLVDHFEYDVRSSHRAVIELGKRLSSQAPPDRSEFDRVIEEFSRSSNWLPSAVLGDQNRELIASLEDIQDKQEELQRLNQELQDTNRGVVALYAELEEKAEQLRNASDAKSRFLANVSHEFRTPLNSILALSRLLLDRVDGDLAPEQEKQVALIRRSAETLLEFVNDLLDLAKVEAGKIEVNVSEFYIRDLLRGLRGVLKPLQKAGTVELVFEECEPISIVSDEGKVGQILRNLISNALKYTERGEVRVKTKVDRAKGTVLFEVSDTGMGIPASDQERIFQEFEQVAGAFQQKNKGSGLGLALARRLARLLRGEIGVESELGVGSTFHLCVPLDYRHPFGTGIDPGSKRGRKRILVVDDEETFRYVVRHIVESETGYELIEAQDGAEGLLRAKRDQPDVIILDLQMPVMSGQDLLTELAADSSTQRIPVIVSTSLQVTPQLEEDLANTFRLVSKSDLSREVLLDVLKQSLRASREREIERNELHRTE